MSFSSFPIYLIQSEVERLISVKLSLCEVRFIPREVRLTRFEIEPPKWNVCHSLIFQFNFVRGQWYMWRAVHSFVLLTLGDVCFKGILKQKWLFSSPVHKACSLKNPPNYVPLKNRLLSNTPLSIIRLKRDPNVDNYRMVKWMLLSTKLYLR